MKKYELTNEFITTASGIKLYRIKALMDFGSVKAGDIGGCIEKEANLDQSGSAWVSGNACVFGNAQVRENAEVRGNAEVSGNAQVTGNVLVSGSAQACGNADYVTVKGFGSVYRTTTFFRERAGSCRGQMRMLLRHIGRVPKESRRNTRQKQERKGISDACRFNGV